MVAPKLSPKIAARVAAKVARRECLAKNCRRSMVVCGCCRAHYDAAEHVISRQPTRLLRVKAREKLVRAGLLLERWQQPRKGSKKSLSAAYQQAVTSEPR